jgi:hypothetical protein
MVYNPLAGGLLAGNSIASSRCRARGSTSADIDRYGTGVFRRGGQAARRGMIVRADRLSDSTGCCISTSTACVILGASSETLAENLDAFGKDPAERRFAPVADEVWQKLRGSRRSITADTPTAEDGWTEPLP